MPKKKSGDKKPKTPPQPKRDRWKSLTRKQSRFVQAFMETRNAATAAIIAGYSRKNPAQSGHQALLQIQKKVPDILDQLGLSVEALVQNSLIPLLNATTVKFAQKEGEFTDYVEVEDNTTRLNALDIAFRLHGAYASKEQSLEEDAKLHVLVMDMPRPIPPPGCLRAAETNRMETGKMTEMPLNDKSKTGADRNLRAASIK